MASAVETGGNTAIHHTETLTQFITQYSNMFFSAAIYPSILRGKSSSSPFHMVCMYGGVLVCGNAGHSVRARHRGRGISDCWSRAYGI